MTIRITESDNFIVDYDTGRGMYRVSTFDEDGHFCDEYWFDAYGAKEVVHGRWEWDTEDIYRCTNCNEKSHVKEVLGRPDWNYCPNCGAKMDGDGND